MTKLLQSSKFDYDHKLETIEEDNSYIFDEEIYELGGTQSNLELSEEESERDYLISNGRAEQQHNQKEFSLRFQSSDYFHQQTNEQKLEKNQRQYDPLDRGTMSQSSSAIFGNMFHYIAKSMRPSSSSNGAGSRKSKSASEFVSRRDWPITQQNTNGIRPKDDSPSEIVHPNRTNYPNDHPSNGHQNYSKREGLVVILFLALMFASIMFFIKLVSLIPPKDQPFESEFDPWNETRYVKMSADFRSRQFQSGMSQTWLVATSKCNIPALNPWDKSIGGYVHRKKPMDCRRIIEESIEKEAKELKKTNSDSLPELKSSEQIKTLSYIRSNKLYFTKEALILGCLTDDRCCYRPIDRLENTDDKLVYSEQCFPIDKQALDVSNNFSLIKVECSHLNYTNVHSLIRHNLDDELAYEKVASKKLDYDKHYNILMLGVDTMSRLNGIRQLNLTLEYLKAEYKTLEFFGYNKVGENTFPNLIPLLTGLRPNQLTETRCWLARNYTEEHEHGDDFLDNCKYLWNFYQELGYVTYFVEDWPSASSFNYLKPGFRNEPTDYYGRPFCLARKELVFPKFHHAIGCASCQLDRPIVEVDLENLKSFIESHQDQPHFVFHWINCPQHDDLNGGSLVDQIIEKFFRTLRKSKQIDRTFVIFFSDHGYRWNDFVSTRIGHHESSLPLMTIAPPAKFIQQHPDLYERLKEHQNSLLTPFDMFKTLIDIRNLAAKEDSSREDRPSRSTSEQTDSSPRSQPTATTTVQQIEIQDGLSFRQPFKTLSLLDKHTPDQLDRSCIEAGIPDNYCVCHQFEALEADSFEALGASYYLVYMHLESQLRNNLNICHQLELERVHRAEYFDFGRLEVAKHKRSRREERETSGPQPKSPKDGRTRQSAQYTTSTTPKPVGARVHIDNEEDKGEQMKLPNREYNVIFSTKPGGGLFQEVVRFYGDKLKACQEVVEKARLVIEDRWAKFEEKHRTVKRMNEVCKFSVHSQSISRLNLYGNQSKCVKSNIELKKICYCR